LQVAMASIVGTQLGNGSKMGKGYAVAVLVLTCVFSASFSWSWGALYWTIPGEIYPVEVRSAGQGTAVALNLGLNFVQAQCFLAMLCCFKYGIFIFYACWLVVMTAFAMAFVPETKGVPRVHGPHLRAPLVLGQVRQGPEVWQRVHLIHDKYLCSVAVHVVHGLASQL
jgi:hypothetical protein